MEYESQRNVKNYIGNKKLLYFIYKNILKNKLHNSIIIHGSEGIGKSTLVYYLSKLIFSNYNDKKLDNIDFIDNHHSNLIENLSHPNFFVLKPSYDIKKKSYKSLISIEQVRELNKTLNLTNTNNLPNIVLIDSGNLLNNNSSNALLKLIEEPKNNTYFFIISDHLNLLLPTIRSRCIKLRVDNLTIEEFKNIIEINDYEFDENENEYLYYFFNGSPGVCIHYLNNNFKDIEKNMIELIIGNQFFNDSFFNFVNSISRDANLFNVYIYIIKFYLINSIKFKLGIIDLNNKEIISNIEEISNKVSIVKIIKVLSYLDSNIKKVKTFNLDRKLFMINSFSQLINY